MNIDVIIEELDSLKKSHDLLESVHLEIGPYGDGELTEKTRFAINDHFRFDDSE